MLAIIVKGFHLLVCIALIVIVLFQADKGEGLAGAFGGGASSTLFGERGGATEISKFTTGLAVVFMITSLVIAIWGPAWEKEADIARTNAYNSQPIVATPAKTQTPAPVTTPNAAMPGLPMTAPVTDPTPITATPAPVSTPAPVTAAPAPVETPAPVTATPAPVETPAPAAVTPAPVETPAPAAVTPAPVETPAPAAVTPAPVETPAPAAVTPAPVETPAPAAETSAAPSVKEEIINKVTESANSVVNQEKEKAENAVKAIVEEKKADVIEAVKEKVENK